MKKFLFALLIFFPATGLYAYSISGKVTDSATGKPVADISVGIEELKMIQKTSTDGTFSFGDIPAGFYTLHTAHPLYGNNSVKIRVKRNFVIDLEQTQTVHKVSPVLNSYKGNSRRPGEQSISSDDIKYMPMSGAGDSLHLLQSLPGVGSSFSMGTIPFIRGINPIYDKTYIDDIPVDYPYHYIPPIVPLLSSINETIIDKASIIKGPYPMIYDDSLGSIIHIKTKEVENPGVHGKIILNPLIPLFPTIYCEAAPTADFSLIFAGRRTYIDWAADAAEIESSNRFYFQDHYLKLRYNLFSKHRIYFTTIGSDDNITTGDLEAGNEYHAESLKWQFMYSRKLLLETSLLRNRTNHYFFEKDEADPIDVSYSPLMYRLMQTLTADVSILDITTGYEYIIHKDGVSGNIALSDLVDYDLSDHTGGTASASFPIEGRTFSVFNETGINIHPVRLNLGARYKYYGPLSSHSVSYRGMASWFIKDKDLKVYAGGGSYHAQPDMYYYLGDINGSLEESKSYNGVAGFEKKITKDITWQIESYYAKYRNLFSGNFSGISSTELQRLSQINPYSKDTSGHTYGAECYIKGNWGPVYGWTSYSLSRSRMSDGTDEYNSDYDQTHIFKAAVLTHQGRWTPSAIWHYYTSMPYTPVTGSTSDGSGGYDPEYGSYNSKRYPAHHRLDAKLTYTRDNIRFYIEVWNIYYVKGYDRDEDKAIKNDTYLFPSFDNDKPYSSSNPEKQKDIPAAFLWAGVEICF
ncbi:MAG: hypothetical protein CVV49_07345 [Spirochaetae bacterium HGW-Spirochaetae-5]|nr:MAG: hypothetical protein CVV49_07345 [Spirochaetae bacterium HGW-Spirochaetae-5]